MLARIEQSVPRCVAALRARGLTLTLIGDQLQVEPKEQISSDMHVWLYTHRGDVKRYLASELQVAEPSQRDACTEPPTPVPRGRTQRPRDAHDDRALAALAHIAPVSSETTRALVNATKSVQRPLVALIDPEPDVKKPHEAFVRIPYDAHERLTDGSVSPHAQALIQYLLRRELTYNARRSVSVSYEQLAVDMHISYTSVRRAITELENLGVLQIAHSTSRKRDKGINTYTITWKGLRAKE